jgi:signal peptidase I
VGAVGRGLLVALINLALIVPGVVWMWVSWAQGPVTALLAMSVTVALLIAVPSDAARCALREPRPEGSSSPVRVVVLHGLFVPIAVTMLHTELSWIRANRVQPFQTPTESMVPTLLPGDYFFVDTRPRTRENLRPGDIVVFDHPARPGVAYAKRVVALAGSVARVEQEGLVVDEILRTEPGNGTWQRLRTERLDGTRYSVSLGQPGELEPFGPVSIPNGHVFVLGDSRAHSRDSREFGPLPVESVRGRVVRVFWSWDEIEQRVRWGRLGLGLGLWE